MKVAGKDFDAGKTVAACGHVIPAWHDVAWTLGDEMFCSLACKAREMTERAWEELIASI